MFEAGMLFFYYAYMLLFILQLLVYLVQLDFIEYRCILYSSDATDHLCHVS